MKMCLKSLLFLICILSYFAHCFNCPPGLYWRSDYGTCCPCDWKKVALEMITFIIALVELIVMSLFSNCMQKLSSRDLFRNWAWFCLNCGANTYSKLGSASCSSNCPAGYYAQVGGNQCLPFPAGTYNSVPMVEHQYLIANLVVLVNIHYLEFKLFRNLSSRIICFIYSFTMCSMS